MENKKNTYHAFRLTKGSDLKQEIIKYSENNHIKAGVVLSCVGCVNKVNIRLAGAKEYFEIEDDFEIVSMTGTISSDGVHIHISVSDAKGKTFGGHLKEGCIVNTTAEIVLLELDNYTFTREYDKNTGYKELVIKEND